jgi:hypothetical protein
MRLSLKNNSQQSISAVPALRAGLAGALRMSDQVTDADFHLGHNVALGCPRGIACTPHQTWMGRVCTYCGIAPVRAPGNEYRADAAT